MCEQFNIGLGGRYSTLLQALGRLLFSGVLDQLPEVVRADVVC